MRVGTAYWCETAACRDRQAAYAIRIGDQPFYVPLPKQIEMELAPVRFLLGGGAAGAAKIFTLDTPIPTLRGLRTMAALKVGDIVFDERGEPAHIIAKSEPHSDPTGWYRVTFDDGSSLVAGGQHEWWTFTYRDRMAMHRRSVASRAYRRAHRARRGLGKSLETITRHIARGLAYQPAPVTGGIFTTLEIAETLHADTARPRLNHAIPLARAWRQPPRALPIDPYLLGVWLGDGNSETGIVTSADAEVLARIQARGGNVYRMVSKYRWRVKGLHRQLRLGGLLKNKHVPEDYFLASRDQRLWLLRGLMDSDGCCARAESSFTNTNRRLAMAVYRLATSLGVKAYWNEYRATLKGKDYGRVFKVSWTDSLQAFTLPRKAERLPEHLRRTQRFRYIVSVEQVPNEVGQCIEVDSPRHLYLAGDNGIPTHNSHMARYGLYRRALAVPGFEGLILRRTWDELKKHHLRLMEKEAAQLAARGIAAEYARTDREFRIRFPDGETSIIEGGHMEDPEDIDKYLSRERDAIVCDEGATFDPQKLLELSTRARSAKPAVEAFARRLWQRPTGSVPGGGAVFWVLSNPGGPAAPMLRDFFIDRTPNFDEYPHLRECDADGRPLYDPTEWTYVPGNLEDNPYLPPSYERDLAVLPPWRYQQLRYNSWDVVAGQFFVEFDARQHVKDLGTPKGDVRWFRSYDYGYVHKGVCLWWAVLPDGRLYIRQEYVHRFQPISEIARQIRQQTMLLRIPRISYTVGDKFSLGMRQKDDAGETRRDIFAQHGVPMDGTNHDREQGWTRCRELLALAPDGQPWVILHPSCRQLIRELSAAISDDHHPEDISEHCDQDALAAFRYGAMSRPSPMSPRHATLSRKAAGYDLRELQSTLADRRRRAFT